MDKATVREDAGIYSTRVLLVGFYRFVRYQLEIKIGK